MKKRRSAEQIVGLLRQADVDLGNGMNVPDVCRRLGISQQTYYRWRTKFGGTDLKMAKQLQELQKENSVVHRPGRDHDAPVPVRRARWARASAQR